MPYFCVIWTSNRSDLTLNFQANTFLPFDLLSHSCAYLLLSNWGGHYSAFGKGGHKSLTRFEFRGCLTDIRIEKSTYSLIAPAQFFTNKLGLDQVFDPTPTVL